MEIPSGKVDQSIYFVAKDSTDHQSRKTGLSSFTVYRGRNGATMAAYTTPTIVEQDSTHAPGVYALLIDEDTTIASTSDSEEYCVHITATGMDPVTRTITLKRPPVTSGNTLLVDSNGRVDVIKVAGTTQTAADLGTVAPAIKTKTDQLVFTVANQVDVNVVDWKGATAPAMTGDAYARLGAPAGASHAADVAAVKTDTAAVKAKTDNLPSDPADASDIAGAFSTVNGTLATIAGYVDTEVAAIKAKTDLIPASPAAVGDIPTANQNADALLDRADAVETGWTLRKVLRILAAFTAGKTSGMDAGAPVFRSITDGKDRITATLDSDNNRTAVTADGS